MSIQAVTDLSQSLPIPEGGIASKPLLDLPGSTKLVLFALDRGQEISPHAAPFPAEIVALEGRIEVRVGPGLQVLEAHQAIELPQEIPHGIRALDPARFLLVMRRGARPAADPCRAHGCHHGAPPMAGPVRHPTLLKWMEEHAEALRRLDLMEEAQERGDWPPVREQALWLYQELKTHNEAEEAHLFPLMDPFFPGDHGPTACMRSEHRQLWDLVLAVLGGITEGRARNPLDTGRACAQLIGLLRAHIEKENEVLYPMAERILAPEALESLGAAMAEG